MNKDVNPLGFFALLFGLSTPFWIAGTLLDGQLLPGLPVSALMAIVPGASALVLVIRHGTAADVRALFAASIDFAQMRPWAWWIAVGTMPLVMVLSAALLLLMGTELPAPEISWLQLVGLFVLFLLAATAEELGWTGYLTGTLVKRHGLVLTALMIGSVAVVWHLIPLLQVGRAWDWIAWWAMGTMARRIIIVWLYVRGGQSVFSASLFHAMNNVSWMMFPVLGSHYDPMTTALITSAIAAIILGYKALKTG